MQPMTTDRGHTLREWHLDDAAQLRDAFDHPDMASQIHEPLSTLADAAGWINERLSQSRDGSAYSWAVATEHTLLGCVTLSSIDRRHDVGWISYWTAPSQRGNGAASSGLRRVASWAFEELGLHRLELGHRVNNPASCRVALAAGFVVEGLERDKLRYGDARFDVELHARLATDRVASKRTV